MLVSFSVSNFRSFGEEQTLNMVASNKLTDHPEHLVHIGDTGKSLVRTATIYGANASGKSNLVRAMAAAQEMVIGQPRSRRRASGIVPFAFRQQAGDEPTSFEFRFLLFERVFIYGFDIVALSNEVKSEWLSLVKGNDDEALIFERHADGNVSLGDSVEKLFPEDEILFSTLEKLIALPLVGDQLLMNRAMTIPGKIRGKTLSGVIQWLTRDLLIIGADERPTPHGFQLISQLEDDEDFRSLTEAFLRNVGTGVDSLDVQSEERDEFDPTLREALSGLNDEIEVHPIRESPRRIRIKRLLANHSTDDTTGTLPFSEESDGTRTLVQLMPVLANALGHKHVVVIDELDRSLHPLICWEFIRFFSETHPGAPKQLIVTTHEAHLLNQALLRRDEYWFVEKGGDQQSHLVSLSDFNVRKDLQIEKSYLQGRFGAIPVIGSMEEIERLLNEQSSGKKRGRDATQEATS